jgi:hypothetical protein
MKVSLKMKVNFDEQQREQEKTIESIRDHSDKRNRNIGYLVFGSCVTAAGIAITIHGINKPDYTLSALGTYVVANGAIDVISSAKNVFYENQQIKLWRKYMEQINIKYGKKYLEAITK